MKRLATILILATTLLVAESFKIKHIEQVKTDGFIMAVIDGKVFEARNYTAELKNKSTGNPLFASAQGGATISRVASVVNLLGSEYQDADGNMVAESIGFEYTFGSGSLGDGADKNITVSYNNQKYYSIAAESEYKVTKITWSNDHRSYVMDADFDCKMRRWGVPASAQPTVKLKGKIENITVSVPSWIVLNNRGASIAETKE